jgi:hypothetical protein
LDSEGLGIFLFETFDLDSSGALTADEAVFLIDLLWGFNTKGNDSLIKAITKVRTQSGNKITLKVFLQLLHQSPIIGKPSYNLQNQLREQTLGNIWIACTIIVSVYYHILSVRHSPPKSALVHIYRSFLHYNNVHS